MAELDLITEQSTGCPFEVHRGLGPGFQEKIDQNALRLLFDRKGWFIDQLRQQELSGEAGNLLIGVFGLESVQSCFKWV